jgi:ABC-type antimicrobial peptide transport system permease subunit
VGPKIAILRVSGLIGWDILKMLACAGVFFSLIDLFGGAGFS